MVKVDFNNPMAFIDTSMSVRPLALDPMDFDKRERVLINRVVPATVLQSNTNNMRFLLYYMKYTWTPQLMPILAAYRYFSWITNNYERFIRIFTNLSTNTTFTAM